MSLNSSSMAAERTGLQNKFIDPLLLTLPGLLWFWAIRSRGTLIVPRCGLHPESCTPAQIPAFDRFFFTGQSAIADRLSFITQDAAGAFAILVPLAFALAAWRNRQSDLRRGIKRASKSWLLLAQAALWNGFFDELARLLTQRPRPFVYTDPLRLGFDPAHYTSFYSGHTSFAATASVSLVLATASETSPWARNLIRAAAVLLVFSTAALRVLAGRHFATDVIAGAAVGATIACLIHFVHRERSLP